MILIILTFSFSAMNDKILFIYFKIVSVGYNFDLTHDILTRVMQPLLLQDMMYDMPGPPYRKRAFQTRCHLWSCLSG